MRVRHAIVLWLTTCATGCAGYTQSKIGLVAQAERGVAGVRGAVEANARRVDASGRSLRRQLDAAFDADVAARPASALTPAWVTEHRKAYGLALDAFDAQRRAAAEADRATLGTLDAVSLVLAQLQQMHASELRLTLPEVKR